MVNFQWHIFWAELSPIKGSVQSGKRPVLVISSESVNSVLPVVAVIPLTTVKPGRQIYPTETLLSGIESGLPKDSIAMAHQIRSLSKQRLGEQCGSIESEETRENVKDAVRLYLQL